MKTILLSISASLFALTAVAVNANELQVGSWNFPTADQIQVGQNRLMFMCDANPERCPVNILRKTNSNGVGGGSGTSLVDPRTSASANNISVVLAGDNSSVTLSTSQDAKDNTMSSDAQVDAEIDYDQVLNYTNNE